MSKTKTSLSGCVVAIICCLALIYLMRYYDEENVYLRAHPNCVLTHETQEAESSYCAKVWKQKNVRTYQCGIENKTFVSCY